MVDFESKSDALEQFRENFPIDSESSESHTCRNCSEEIDGTLLTMDDGDEWFICTDGHATKPSLD